MDNSGDLFVGGDAAAAGGTATLNVENLATVSVAGTITIWDQGTVNLSGGTISANAIQFNGSKFNFNIGTIQLAQSTTLTPLTL